MIQSKQVVAYGSQEDALRRVIEQQKVYIAHLLAKIERQQTEIALLTEDEDLVVVLTNKP
jgi:hypothetical protein